MTLNQRPIEPQLGDSVMIGDRRYQIVKLTTDTARANRGGPLRTFHAYPAAPPEHSSQWEWPYEGDWSRPRATGPHSIQAVTYARM